MSDTRSRIVGAVDHPTHASFGTFDTIRKDALGCLLHVERSPPEGMLRVDRYDAYDYQRGVEVGGILPLEDGPRDVPLSYVLVWVGCTVQQRLLEASRAYPAEDLDWTPPVGSPYRLAHSAPGGTYWMLPFEDVWASLEAWRVRATSWLLAQRTLQADVHEHHVARVLRRLAPFSPDTYGALDHVYRNTPQQGRHRSWHARVRVLGSHH